MTIASAINSKLEKYDEEILMLAREIVNLRINIIWDLLGDEEVGPMCIAETETYDTLSEAVEKSVVNQVLSELKKVNTRLDRKEP